MAFPSRPCLLSMAALVVAALTGCPSATSPEPTGSEVAVPEPVATPASPAAGDVAAGTAAVPPVNYRCGDLLLTAHFDNLAGNATLRWLGGKVVLPQAVAASGTRYADTGGNEFWIKGDDASLVFDGQPAQECAVSADVSPWEDARRRGIVLRGMGTEPGWIVEVGSGDSPELRAQLDYGEREIVVPKAFGISSTKGFGGKTADGVDLVLRVVDGACSDGMSDARYSANVELSVGDQRYTGCGAWLHD